MMRAVLRRRHRRLAGVVVVLCGWLWASSAACRAPLPALSHTQASADDLARAILDRLATGDRAGLEELRLTRDEFEAHVWPHLPVSRPETNMPMAFVWNRLSQQSDGRLAQLLARHGGRRYAFVAIAFTGERSRYGEVDVWRDSVVTVRTPDGALDELELFGSMIGQDGQVKVFSYVTD